MKKSVLMRMPALVLVLILAAVCLCGCGDKEVKEPETVPDKYTSAVNMFNDGRYDAAAAAFDAVKEYNDAPQMRDYCTAIHAGETGDYAACLKGFEALGDFRDSVKMTGYYTARQMKENGQYDEAAAGFAALGSFRDAAAQIADCENHRNYDAGIPLVLEGKFEEASAVFEKLGAFGDSSDVLAYCKARLQMNEGNFAAAEKTFGALEKSRFSAFSGSKEFIKTKALASYCAGRRLLDEKKYDDAFEALSGAGILDAQDVIAGDAELIAAQARADAYDEAKKLKKDGKYADAADAYEALGSYKDSANAVQYCSACLLMNENRYDEAAAIFRGLGDYDDSKKQVAVCGNGPAYEAALALMDGEKYQDAADAFGRLEDFRDSKDKASECRKNISYAAALEMEKNGEYAGAAEAFKALGKFSDSEEHMKACFCVLAAQMSAEGSFDDAYALYADNADPAELEILLAGNEGLAAAKERADAYAAAVNLQKKEKDYDGAAAAFAALGDYLDSAELVAECKNLKTYDFAQNLCSSAATELTQKQAIDAYLDRTASAGPEAEQALLDGAAEAVKKLEKDEDFTYMLLVLTEPEPIKHSGLIGSGINSILEQMWARMTPADIYGGSITAKTAAGINSVAKYKLKQATAVFGEIADYRADIGKSWIPYCNALMLVCEKKYDEAITAFEPLAASNFRTSPAQLKECRYQKAKQLMNEGKYDEAYAIFAVLTGYRDVDSIIRNDANIHEAKLRAFRTAGNYVLLGSYTQGATSEKTPIEWRVLDYDEVSGRSLLVSRYALDKKTYHNEKKNVTWEECTLRTWLNDKFAAEAFTEAELGAVVTSVSYATGNTKYDMDPGAPTADRVFCLSVLQAEKYFADDEARKCVPTVYAVKQGVYQYGNRDDEKQDKFKLDGQGCCWWWLRTPGTEEYYTALVSRDGSIYYEGYDPSYTYYAVRPAVWVDAELVP